MKKLGRPFLPTSTSRRVFGAVCASALLVGALLLGSFISIPLLSRWFQGGAFLDHDLIKKIHIQGNWISRVHAVEIKEVEIAHESSARVRLLGRRNEVRDGLLHDNINDEVMSAMKDSDLRGSLTKEKMEGNQQRCTKSKALLKVFMYDLPPELHFGMIESMNVKKGNTWPTNLTDIVSYPGGLNQQHSPEYWLTLDLLNNLESEEEEEEEEGHISLHSFYDAKLAGGHTFLKTSTLGRHNNSTDSHPHPRVHEGSHHNHLVYHNKTSLSPRIENEYGKGFSNPIVKDISRMEETRRPCGAIRVKEPKDADVYFVPFFASLSYNKYTRMGMRERDTQLQKKLVDFLVKQEAWKRSRGRDHVIVMHHPNSLHMARALLQGATFVVADFGRFSSKVAHLGKDVVAPYKHIIPSFHDDHSSFDSRRTLLFFQGAIVRKESGIIRKKLYYLIKNEKGVVFKGGVSGHEGIKSATKGMRSSKFCLHLAGDTPSSNRLFDAIASHCVPVIISKDIELPYENVLDYSSFCLFVNSFDALKKGFLIDLLKSIERDEWTRMWKRLIKVQVHFEYQFPSQVDDAVQMVWKSIAYKVPTIKQGLHKSYRHSSSNMFENLLPWKSIAYKKPTIKQGLRKSYRFSRSKKLSSL